MYSFLGASVFFAITPLISASIRFSKPGLIFQSQEGLHDHPSLFLTALIQLAALYAVSMSVSVTQLSVPMIAALRKRHFLREDANQLQTRLFRVVGLMQTCAHIPRELPQ